MAAEMWVREGGEKGRLSGGGSAGWQRAEGGGDLQTHTQTERSATQQRCTETNTLIQSAIAVQSDERGNERNSGPEATVSRLLSVSVHIKSAGGTIITSMYFNVSIYLFDR